MGHILRLADEYQAEGVHDFCVKTLRDMSKSKDNAVKIFFLTTQTAMARDDERLGHVRSQCREIIKNMDLANIKGSSDFQNLNRDDYESLLEKRIRRLETFVSQIYPQFIGLVEYCLYLGLECELPGLTCCPVHFPGGTSKVTIGLPGRIGNCSVCQKIIQTMVKRSRTFQRKTSVSSFRTQVKREHVHVYGGEHHFDTAVISIVNDFTEVRDNLQGGKSPGFRL